MRQFGKRKRVKTKNAVQVRYSTKSKYARSKNVMDLENLLEKDHTDS